MTIWSADLDRIRLRPEVLSADEVARSERFRSQEMRERYIAGRTWLRCVLGSALSVDPSVVRFRYLELGKPVLEHPRGALDFSLAHSGPSAMLGIGPPGGVGVDVERLAPGAYDRSSAAVVMSADELRWIESGEDPDRDFLRCWVRKEAYAKVEGMGMDRYLANLTLTGPGASGAHLDIAIHDLDADGDLVAAVALPKGRPFAYRGAWLEEEAA